MEDRNIMGEIFRGTPEGERKLRCLQEDAKKKGKFKPTKVTIFNTYMYRLLKPHWELLNLPCPRPENLSEETATNMGPLIGLFIRAFLKVTNFEPLVFEYDTRMDDYLDIFESAGRGDRNVFVKTCAALADMPEKSLESALESPNTFYGSLTKTPMPNVTIEILNNSKSMKGGTREENLNRMNTSAIDAIGSRYGLADGAGWGSLTKDQKIQAIIGYESSREPGAAAAPAGILGRRGRVQVSAQLRESQGTRRVEELNRLFEVIDRADAIENALRELQRVFGPRGADPQLVKRIEDLFIGYHEKILKNAIQMSVIGGQTRTDELERAMVNYLEDKEKKYGRIGSLAGKPVRKINFVGKMDAAVSKPAAFLAVLAAISAASSVALFNRLTGAAPFVMPVYPIEYPFTVVPFRNKLKIIVLKEGSVATYVYDPKKMRLTESAQAIVDAELAKKNSPSGSAPALLAAPSASPLAKVLKLPGQPQIAPSGVTGVSPANEVEPENVINLNATPTARPSATATPLARVNSLAQAGITAPTPTPTPTPEPESSGFWEVLSLVYDGFENMFGPNLVNESALPSPSPAAKAAPGPTAAPPSRGNNSRALVLGRPENSLALVDTASAVGAEPTPRPDVFYLNGRLVVTAPVISEFLEPGAKVVNERDHWRIITGGPETYNLAWNNFTRQFEASGVLADLDPGEVYNPITGQIINPTAQAQRDLCYRPGTYLGDEATFAKAMAAAAGFGYLGGSYGLALGFGAPYAKQVYDGVNQCGGILAANARSGVEEVTSTAFNLLGGIIAGALAIFFSVFVLRFQGERYKGRKEASDKLDQYNKKIVGRLSEIAQETLQTELRNNLVVQISDIMKQAEEVDDISTFFLENGFFDKSLIPPFLERIGEIDAEIAALSRNAKKLKVKREQRKRIISDFMYTAFLPVFIDKWYEQIQSVLSRRFGGRIDPIMILAKTVADKVLTDQTMLDNADELLANIKRQVAIKRGVDIVAESADILAAIQGFRLFGQNELSDALTARVPNTVAHGGTNAAAGGGPGVVSVNTAGGGGSVVARPRGSCGPGGSADAGHPSLSPAQAAALAAALAAPPAALGNADNGRANASLADAAALAAPPPAAHGANAAPPPSGNGNGGEATGGRRYRKRRVTRKRRIIKRKATRKH